MAGEIALKVIMEKSTEHKSDPAVLSYIYAGHCTCYNTLGIGGFVLRLTILLVLTSLVLLGAPSNCAPGSLSDYLALDSEGCRLGTRVLSGFTLESLLPFASEINQGSVQITPSAAGLTGSLLFTYN